MRIKDGMMSRRFSIQTREEELDAGIKALYVEGCAAVYESETVLFEIEGVEYKEKIARGAFDGCKMEDVIFNYNHQGKVMARTRNKTLELFVDATGLRIRARLDGTEEGRQLYEEIQGGYIDRMSFAFTVEEESYNQTDHEWTVLKVKRLYDVSAVDIPAYDDTSIEARKSAILEADAQEKKRLAAEAALARKKLEVKLKI